MVTYSLKSFKVFVYGTLKQGYGNNEYFLGGSEYLGPAVTGRADYDMVSLGGFPGVLSDGENAILGEVYKVDEATLARLDSLESNGSLYQREQIRCYTVEGDELWGVWIYIFLQKSWARPGRSEHRSYENVDAYTVGDTGATVEVQSWAKDTWDVWTDSNLGSSSSSSSGEAEFETELTEEEYAEYIAMLLDEQEKEEKAEAAANLAAADMIRCEHGHALEGPQACARCTEWEPGQR